MFYHPSAVTRKFSSATFPLHLKNWFQDMYVDHSRWLLLSQGFDKDQGHLITLHHHKFEHLIIFFPVFNNWNKFVHEHPSHCFEWWNASSVNERILLVAVEQWTIVCHEYIYRYGTSFSFIIFSFRGLKLQMTLRARPTTSADLQITFCSFFT